MSRPPLEVADIIRAAGDAFIERNRHWLGWKHVKVLLAIVRCRTAALGGHLDECTRCGHRAPISYNSCIMGRGFYWRVERGKRRAAKATRPFVLPINTLLSAMRSTCLVVETIPSADGAERRPQWPPVFRWDQRGY